MTVRQEQPPLTMEEGEAKFRELLLYIAMRHEDAPDFGATRLYKALFDADFGAYVATGQPITGHRYIKAPHGPLPERGREILDELVANGDAAIERRTHNGYPQRRIVALREPNLELFTAREIALVDRLNGARHGGTATRAGAPSYLEAAGWRAAAEGEVMPYESSWVAPRELTPDEVAYGMRLTANG